MRIDDLAHVVGADHNKHKHLTSFDIDLNFDGFGHIAIGESWDQPLPVCGSKCGGRRRVIHEFANLAGRSSSRHLRKAISAAPRMALPDMKVRREAEALPDEPDVAVSDAMICYLVKGYANGISRHLGQERYARPDLRRPPA